jgi:hypothetical protein
VRVPHSDGTAAGAGVLVDQHHVVTCAHVVAQYLGEPADTAGSGQAPDDMVAVEFPFTGDTPVRRAARVVQWQPIAEDQSGDAAILRLSEPVVLTPAPLAFPSHVQSHRFSVHGFPGGDTATAGHRTTWRGQRPDRQVGPARRGQRCWFGRWSTGFPGHRCLITTPGPWWGSW